MTVTFNFNFIPYQVYKRKKGDLCHPYKPKTNKP